MSNEIDAELVATVRVHLSHDLADRYASGEAAATAEVHELLCIAVNADNFDEEFL